MIVGASIFDLMDSFDSWVQIFVLIIMLHATGVGVIYMIARMVNSRKYEVIAKSEVQNVVSSILILIIITGTATIMNNFHYDVTNSYYYNSSDVEYFNVKKMAWNSQQPASSPYYDKQGYYYTNGHSNAKISDLTEQIANARLFYGVLSSDLSSIIRDSSKAAFSAMALDYFTSDLQMQFQSFSFSMWSSLPLNGLAITINRIIFRSLIGMLYLSKFVENTLLFLDYGVGAFLFIFGIIFRIVPPTKKLGALLLAMGYVLYYVFPFLIMISMNTVQYLNYDLGNLPKVESDGLLAYEGYFEANEMSFMLMTAAGIGASLRGDVFSSIFSTLSVILYVYMSSVYSIILSNYQSYAPALLGFYSNADKIGLFDYMGYYYFSIVVITIFNLYITLSLIKGLSKFFGGNFEIPALSRLI